MKELDEQIQDKYNEIEALKRQLLDEMSKEHSLTVKEAATVMNIHKWDLKKAIKTLDQAKKKKVSPLVLLDPNSQLFQVRPHKDKFMLMEKIDGFWSNKEEAFDTAEEAKAEGRERAQKRISSYRG